MKRGPTSSQVIEAVCLASGLSRSDIVGSCRLKRLARPRQMAAYIMCQRCPHLSFSAIGRALGGRDHSTITHARDVMRCLLDEDSDLAALHNKAVEILERRISGFAARGGRALRMASYVPPTPPAKPKVRHQKPVAFQGASKDRACLMCNGNFTSSWAGERVCKDCKTTVHWREGDFGQAWSTGRHL